MNYILSILSFSAVVTKPAEPEVVKAADGPTRNSGEQSLGADGEGDAETLGRKSLAQKHSPTRLSFCRLNVAPNANIKARSRSLWGTRLK